MKYTSSQFIEISSSDCDLSPLEIPDDWVCTDLAVHDSGPLANLVLDGRGVLHQSEAEAHVRLCNDCFQQLKSSQMPKFALANNLYFGGIPCVLRDMSPVEESMIALCQAQCIMVQLKTMRGGHNSQRAY